LAVRQPPTLSLAKIDGTVFAIDQTHWPTVTHAPERRACVVAMWAQAQVRTESEPSQNSTQNSQGKARFGRGWRRERDRGRGRPTRAEFPAPRARPWICFKSCFRFARSQAGVASRMRRDRPPCWVIWPMCGARPERRSRSLPGECVKRFPS